jgi:hypothetical protein
MLRLIEAISSSYPYTPIDETGTFHQLQIQIPIAISGPGRLAGESTGAGSPIVCRLH